MSFQKLLGPGPVGARETTRDGPLGWLVGALFSSPPEIVSACQSVRRPALPRQVSVPAGVVGGILVDPLARPLGETRDTEGVRPKATEASPVGRRRRVRDVRDLVASSLSVSRVGRPDKTVWPCLRQHDPLMAGARTAVG